MSHLSQKAAIEDILDNILCCCTIHQPAKLKHQQKILN